MSAVVEVAPQPVPDPVPEVPEGRRRAPRERFRRVRAWWTGVRTAQRPAVSDQVSVASSSLTVLAVVCAWLLLQLLVLSGLAQDREQTLLHDQLRADLAAATTPVGGIIAPGTPVAQLSAPSIDLEQVVVEGTGAGQLTEGPGHRRDTVMPGQAGTSVVYGRAVTHGGPFGDVTDLVKGDVLEVTTGQGVARYTVEGVRRTGDPLPQPLAAGEGRLTLVTAEGSGRLSALSAGSAVYVDAELATEPQAAPAGRLSAVTDAELPMGTDSSAMAALALALGALLAVAAGLTWLARRVGAPLAWVLGLAPVLAAAWVAGDMAVHLLPNLL
jgi:sortase A